MLKFQQVKQFATKARKIPRKEAHNSRLECPVCTHFVKAINAFKHIRNAHPEYVDALVCEHVEVESTALAAI
jgi:hypothetical protein